MLCGSTMQGMRMEGQPDSGQADVSLFAAFNEVALKSAGDFQEICLLGGVIFLYSAGTYGIWSAAAFGQSHFRLLVDASCHVCAGFCDLPGAIGFDVGSEVHVRCGRLALAGAFDSACYSAENRS